MELRILGERPREEAEDTLVSAPLPPPERPLFDAPTERVGVGNMAYLLTSAAFGLGAVLAAELMRLLPYLPLPWLVLVICAYLVLGAGRDWLLDRWLRRTMAEREHLRASRGLFFHGVDFFLSMLFGAAFAIVVKLVSSTIDTTSETLAVQIFIAAFEAVLFMATLQLPMVTGLMAASSPPPDSSAKQK